MIKANNQKVLKECNFFNQQSHHTCLSNVLFIRKVWGLNLSSFIVQTMKSSTSTFIKLIFTWNCPVSLYYNPCLILQNYEHFFFLKLSVWFSFMSCVLLLEEDIDYHLHKTGRADVCKSSTCKGRSQKGHRLRLGHTRYIIYIQLSVENNGLQMILMPTYIVGTQKWLFHNGYKRLSRKDMLADSRVACLAHSLLSQSK